MARHLGVSLIAVVCLVLAACGDDDDDSSPSVPAGSPSATSVPEIRAPDAALLTVSLPAGEIAPAWPSIITSGDFNGDGDTDILIGAPMADGPDGSRTDAGAAYILFGPLEGEHDAQDAAGLTVLGAVAGDNLGSGVASGDLNADGVDDIIVGASGSNALENLRTDMGEAYVVFGGPDLEGTVDTLNQEQDFTLQPAEGFAQVGRALAAGDVNGDGIDDLIAGAPYGGRQPGTEPGGPRTTLGEVYVVYGGPDLAGLVSVADGAEDVRLTGLREFDQFGGSVAVADVSGDGSPDIIAGASGYDGTDSESDAAGAVFVFNGGNDFPAVVPTEEASLTISGPEAYSLGTLVSAADLDGDGRAEIIATAPSAHAFDGRASAGQVFQIAPSAATGAIDLDLCECAVAVSGPAELNLFPAALAAAADTVAMGTGVIAGSTGRTYVTEDWTADLDLAVESVTVRVFSDSGGDAIAFADLDGDGEPELLVLVAGPGAPVLYGVRPGG